MSRFHLNNSLILSAVMAACPAVHAAAAAPLGTAFTYQGQLNDAGTPLDNTADFQFRLFDAASAGTLIAGPVSASNVDVIEGLFTATVDFGAPAFSGEARWLEIAVRSPAGSGAFTTLSTRQPLTAAPYARFAANAGAAPWAGLTGVPAGFADGIDAGSGDGHSLDAADGSPVDAVYVDNSGKVGVGTTAPNGGLHVKNEPVPPGGTLALEGTTHTYMTFFPDGLAAGRKGYVGFPGAAFVNLSIANEYAGGGIVLAPGSGGTARIDNSSNGAMDVVIDAGVTAPHFAALGFQDRGTTKWGIGKDPANDFFIDETGVARRVTISPGGLMDVNGTVRTGVLEITGADLAEKFPTSDIVEPGMVVAIDPCNPGKLCRASGAYNRAVASVVSGANDFSAGAILGNLPEDKDAPPVALSGRVYVWCDTSAGAIEPGDLLTTSDTPGHAMKATDRERAYGAVIGKAMTGFDSGRGLVLVLVSLQ